MKRQLRKTSATIFLALTIPLVIMNALPYKANAATHNVIIFDLAFSPQNLTISVGDTVTWQNNDPLIYTLWFTRVSDGSTYFLSLPIAPSESWSYTFTEPVMLLYYSFERLWITGFINVQATQAETGLVGINGYNLVFKETMRNFLNSPVTIDYYWSFSIDKWNGTQWLPTTISGSSTPVVGYVIPANSTVNLPYYAYILPISGPEAMKWCDWLKIRFTFHWTYSSINYDINYVEKLHVHSADIAGKTPAPPPGDYWSFPYFAADGRCNINDASILGAHWQHRLPPLGDPHPGGTYAYDVNDASGWCRRADINGDKLINIGDVSIIGASWQKTWTNAPPPG